MSQNRPKRLRRDKLYGWRCPEGAKYVGRPSRWGNPFKVGEHAKTHEAMVAMFRDHLEANPELLAAGKRELKGFDLACWCRPDQPCHADIWLDVVNEDGPDESQEDDSPG